MKMSLSPPIDNERTANIIGIDPGTTNLGLSVLSFDVLDFKIVRTEAITLRAQKLGSYSKILSNSHGDVFARVAALSQAFREIYAAYSPISVVAESPFYNPKRPRAYGSLLNITINLQLALLNYGNDKPIYFIDPSSIKNAVGAKGGAGKEPVRDGVMQIRDKISLVDGLYDEHSIDAIAASFAYYKRFIDKDI